MPFGAGPRQCIGMRLAILNAKIVLIEILRKYKFALSPDTKVWYNIQCACMLVGMCPISHSNPY